ncbi:MAG TPA: nucleoside 2-deoxyribosyltransferase [Pseudoneobacillus sp.]|nr:nucleoside 2-deoxyribosyltransferase [Pseudoneobacillus sp.]
MKLNGYLASHFFNDAGLMWTEMIARKLREYFPQVNWYVPQENGEINDKEANDATITDIGIARGDNAHLKETNILVSCLDGVEIDSGVASEIGYMVGRMETEKELSVHPTPRFIVGIYTDMRQVGTGDNHFYINMYVKGNVRIGGTVVKSVDEVIIEIAKFIRDLNTDIPGRI